MNKNKYKKKELNNKLKYKLFKNKRNKYKLFNNKRYYNIK